MTPQQRSGRTPVQRETNVISLAQVRAERIRQAIAKDPYIQNWKKRQEQGL